MLIKRDIDALFEKRMFGGKVLVVNGPRRAGVSLPKTFVSAYPYAACRTVVPGNVMEFLM